MVQALEALVALQALDTAAYWAPALLDGAGEPVEPLRSVAYYRAGRGVDPASVVAFPAGLQMVAGNADATEPQPTSVVAWSCGTGAVRAVRARISTPVSGGSVSCYAVAL